MQQQPHGSDIEQRLRDIEEGLRRFERAQMRSFEVLKAGQQEQIAQLKEQGERLDRIERNLEALVDTARDHKQAMDALTISLIAN